MFFEEVINTRNWKILNKIAFPLKIKIMEHLDSSIYSISTHIQRYDETSLKGLPISEDLLSITKRTEISPNIERAFDYIMDAKYLEYDVFKLSDIVLSFRLYFDSAIVRVSRYNKEYVYSLYMSVYDIQKIADGIKAILKISEQKEIRQG